MSKSDNYISITACAIFIFSPESELSKLSNNYTVTRRTRLITQVKKDITKEISSDIGKDIIFKWSGGSKANMMISSLDLLGICEVKKSDITKDRVESSAKKLAKTFTNKFGKGTACHIGIYLVEEGKSDMIDSFIKN